MNPILPNGTIILLEGGNKKLMIYGRKQLHLDEEKVENEQDLDMYDYIGVPYPEGFIDQEHTYLFNYENIAQVIFEGFQNEEEEKFQEVLKEV